MYYVGIDLGTTNSCIAYYSGGSPKMLTLSDGRKTMPSCVMFNNGEVIVGMEAYKNRHLTDQVVYSAKRDMGTDTEYTISDGAKQFKVTPVEISAHILRALKAELYKTIRLAPNDVVITVPAYFTDRQKKATIEAGKLAGFENICLAIEPSVAAMLYTQKSTSDEEVLIYDLGGGTFDTSLVKVHAQSESVSLSMFQDIIDGTAGKTSSVMITNVSGDNRLGGDDYDLSVLDIMFAEVNSWIGTVAKEHKIKVPANWNFKKTIPAEERERVLLNIEAFKKIFSVESPMCRIPVEVGVGGIKLLYNFSLDVTKMQRAFQPILNKTFKHVDSVLKSTVPDKIVLIGGSTLSPVLRDAIKRRYRNIKVHHSFSPDFSVALGASLYAATLAGKTGLSVLDIVPQTIGICVDSIRAGVRVSDRFQPIIPKGSTLPVEANANVRTDLPEQTEVKLEVFEGDSMFAKENSHIGTMHITGIIPKTDEPTPISIRMLIGVDGLLRLVVYVDERREELELLNVVTSENRAQSTLTPEQIRLNKTRGRLERLFGQYKLTAAEKKTLQEQQTIWDTGEAEQTPKFKKLAAKYQAKYLSDSKAIEEQTIAVTNAEDVAEETIIPEADALETDEFQE